MSAQKVVQAQGPDKRRVIALVGVIAALVGYLLWEQLAPGATASGARGAVSTGAVAATGSALPPGAPVELDARGLTNHYAPVLAARPFTARSFRPPPRETPRRPERTPDRLQPRRERPSEPEDLELLLTGTIGIGPGRIAYLEHRESGRALQVREGDEVGPTTVAKVETAALVLSEGGKTRRLELGELLKLPHGQERRLETLRTAPPPAESSGRPGSGGAVAGGAPAPSAEERAALLERLRQRRLQSMQAPPSTETNKQDDAPPPEGQDPAQQAEAPQEPEGPAGGPERPEGPDEPEPAQPDGDDPDETSKGAE